MAHDVVAGPAKGKLVIRNLGLVLSGDLDRPILDADTIVVVDGRISAIGKAAGLDLEQADMVIDAKGSAVSPGLIDSHCHPVFGDWTPRQNQLGWIEMGVNGGVTTLVSAGEVHLPGRPKDAVGVKALAITAQRCFQNFRPAGAKVIAGAPVAELDFGRELFEELKANGIRHIGEIGLGTVAKGRDAKRVVDWCREIGLETIMHTGGPSIAGSHFVDRDDVLEAQPDVVSHINGGPTSIAHADVRILCEQAKGALEVVHNGNERSALVALEAAQEAGRLADLLIGTDAPAGSGVQPNGVLRMITLLSSLGNLPAEQAFCLATGNIAKTRKLDAGLIAVGMPADFVFLDKPQHSSGKDLLEAVSFGDIPGIGMVMIDGIVRTGRSRSTPPSNTAPIVVGH
ncbi:amidohydrolase family protein [Bosea lathyri]|uniref:Enamidase n=1 Tax=Bosea lathyri TaxID=1036778 RepID=A0A1H5V254_9HYPH|nr:amidohydrolase family protein [Bosea lathyri]SEF80781.1 enamidase [Bosea lathyri]